MRKLFTIIIYTFIILLIGRNLPQLPRFNVLSTAKSYPNEIKDETKKLIAKAPGNYAMYYADLTENGGSFGINEKETFTGASINKVHIIAALYYLENKGKIDLDDQITLHKNDIQDYGTGSLRYQKPGKMYSFKTLAKLALQQSDNTAAYIIANKIGRSVIQDIMDDLGLEQTSIEDNKTSPYDMYLIYKLIHTNKITTQAKSQEILSFMRDTNFEDRIPANLPEGASVWHKTGDAVGGTHDAGIIQYKEQLFFLAVMSSDIADKEPEAKQTIAQISRNIIDFYDKRR